MSNDAKRIINVIIGIILFILIFGFTICCLTKKVIKNDLINSVVKAELKFNESSEELQKLMEGNEINGVIDGLIDDSIDSIKTEKYEISEETFDDLKEYIKDNKEVFESAVGEEVDIESIVDSEEFEDLKTELNKSFQSLSQLSDKQKKAIKTFSKITSTAMIMSLLVGIIALLLALFLINKSVLIPMLVGGIDLIVSGVFTSGIFVIMKIMFNLIAKSTDSAFTFSPSRILVAGIIEVLLGVLLLVIRKVLIKKDTTEAEKPVKEAKTTKKSSSNNKKKGSGNRK